MHKKFTAAIASAALAMSIAICAVPGLPVMSAEVTETNPAAETKTQEQTRAAAPDTLETPALSAEQTDPVASAAEPATQPESQSESQSESESSSDSEKSSEDTTGNSTEKTSETTSEKTTDSEKTSEIESNSETQTSGESESASERETLTESESASGSGADSEKEKDKDKDKDKKKETESETESETETENTGLSELYLAVSGYPVASLTENEAAAYRYLRDELQLNKAAASGVLANIYCESNFSTVAIGDGGTSLGLCQWHAGRCQSLMGWCQANGYDYRSIDGQLHYLGAELNGGYSGVYSYLQSVPDTADGAYAAGHYFCWYFESPDAVATRSDARGKIAANTYYPADLDALVESVYGKKDAGQDAAKAVSSALSAVGTMGQAFSQN
jgi:chemotaxis protein histidine kinase CheA